MLSIPHLIVIFIVALVVFGPEKIPELARNLGKIMAEFRRVTGDLRTTFEGHLRDLEREADTRRIAAPAAAPAATLPAAAPAAAPGIETQPAPAAPGTVTSNPPNAAAIAGPPGDHSAPAVTDAVPEPPDPMHDPYLMHMDIPSENFPNESEPSEPEQKTERVTDGDRRNS
jgi:sec-independent protein translocase protein TatB